jgi:hypothetical protein
MASMFGGFGGLSQIPGRNTRRMGAGGTFQSVSPMGGFGGGGFPGVYPAMGPGQSGAAGLLELQERTRKCMREGTCQVTYGPASYWLGRPQGPKRF